MSFLIRPMVKEDLGQVGRIDREAFPTQWPPANYRHELQNRLAHYIVVIDDSRMAEVVPIKSQSGLLKLAARFLPWLKTNDDARLPASRSCIAGFSGIWMMADEAHITNIAVRRAYQGNGIGGLLLLATIDLALELKASFLTLEVRASNSVAQQLYGRYGFSQMGTRRGYYLDNREDAVIMSTGSIVSPEFQAQLEQLRKSLAKKLSPESGTK